MAELRLYNQLDLIELKDTDGGVSELERRLAMVESSIELTPEEKDKNVEMIKYALTGEVSVSKEVLNDIEAGKADTSDMEGGR